MKDIIIYTQPQCPPCEFAKNYFRSYGFQFIEKNIAKDPQARKELMHKYDAYSTPTIIIGSEVIVGFCQERINKLLSIQ
ncbi:glutaredoxin domain-containing protein [Peribacillus tepidiphilus]|jgi:glutaredoxin-like YruB-family protein|uniref:glutaredoxin domain-containing protein n=1 Tax=Peribacillus tepidiphilus TaxID=2652445 RepID=UPI0035B507F9